MKAKKSVVAGVIFYVLVLVLGLVGSAFGIVEEDFEGLTAQPWTNPDGTDNGAGLPDFTNSGYDASPIGSIGNVASAGNGSPNAMHSIAGSSENRTVYWQPAGFAAEMKPVIDLSFDLKIDVSGIEGDTGGRTMVGWHVGGAHYIDLWFQARVNGTAQIWGRELFGTVDPDAGYLEAEVTGLVVGAWNTVEIHIDENAGAHGETSARINGGAWATVPRSLYTVEAFGISSLKHTLTGQTYIDNISVTATSGLITLSDMSDFCPKGDLNGDCAVNWQDVDLLGLLWLSGQAYGDLDDDNNVDANDFAIIANQWKEVEQFPGFIIDSNITATACSGTGPQETVNRSGLINRLHDTEQTNMWRSVAGGAGGSNPNPGSEAGAAWIKYEFDKVYDINDMWLWNYNEAGSSDSGLRNVSVEYSTDGISYTKLGDSEFAQADGIDNMQHNFGVDFGDASAKYVVITAKSSDGNWGGSYYGLSEVRFDLARSSMEISTDRKLPARGASCPLTVEELNAYNATPGSTIDFYAQYDDGEPVLLSQEPVAIGSSFNWVPTQNGPYKLWCDLDGTISTIREVFVTEKKLHFGYWTMPDETEYATSYMRNASMPNRTNLYRGIKPTPWKNGMHLTGYDDIDFYNYWLTMPDQFAVGAQIDEFSAANDAEAEAMGRALQWIKRDYPDFYLVPWAISIPATGGPDKIAGFAASDEVIAETYAGDFRLFENKLSRYEHAPSRGIEHNTVASIGFGTWVNTINELRLQFEYMRSNFPEMPGVGFYGTGTQMQYDVLDEIIYEYFLGPAVRAEVVASTLEVRNIGSLTAEDVNVIFHTTGGDVLTT
ncbi:hypothetical protein ACFL3G_12260, partial [Planctomycetota bacterium]